MSLTELRVIGLPGIPIVTPGMDLAALIQQASTAAPLPLQAGDILVVTQKVVSKAEGHLIVLKDITPSPLAESFAQTVGEGSASCRGRVAAVASHCQNGPRRA